MILPDESATLALGARLAREIAPGQTWRLIGPLGAGKTTLVRGLLAALGWRGPVRSPTFNLLQEYPTRPPVIHADLYRVASAEGTGLDDYVESHVLLIEWPDRLGEGSTADGLIELTPIPEGRRALVRLPGGTMLTE